MLRRQLASGIVVVSEERGSDTTHPATCSASAADGLAAATVKRLVETVDCSVQTEAWDARGVDAPSEQAAEGGGVDCGVQTEALLAEVVTAEEAAAAVATTAEAAPTFADAVADVAGVVEESGSAQISREDAPLGVKSDIDISGWAGRAVGSEGSKAIQTEITAVVVDTFMKEVIPRGQTGSIERVAPHHIASNRVKPHCLASHPIPTQPKPSHPHSYPHPPPVPPHHTLPPPNPPHTNQCSRSVICFSSVRDG